jgi:hypothetical protein
MKLEQINNKDEIKDKLTRIYDAVQGNPGNVGKAGDGLQED